mgnify:CR=1 FL=1|jgi:catechol 2,3-dioxygenase-like lactoylglutathione lyase family enzyme
MKSQYHDLVASTKSISHSRRKLLKALPVLAFAPGLFAQQSTHPVAVRKLHSFGLRVSDMDRSLKFYQDIFGSAVQARQGDTVCLRIGDGPRFFSLSPVRAGEQPGISHIGLSVEDFELESVRDQLDDFGIARSTKPAPGQPALDSAMRSWVDNRGQDAGGSVAGTQDLYFAGLEGLVFQLSAEDYCGGSGPLGNVCERLEPASTAGLFESIDLSHFTNFLANNTRGNEFYTRIFAKSYQAYQGPGSPIVGVGDGIQFLMYVGGSEDGPPTQPGRIDHVCLSVEDFDVDAIIADLEDYGFTARESASNTPPLVHWISMRMPNRGGIEGGTPEVYFSDPDGIRIQVQDASYCGGGGYLGDICEPLA